ncbi:MAG TPA: SIR2 family protein, partial [Polyangiaceae bacterium]
MAKLREILSQDELTLFSEGVKQGAYRLLLGAGFSVSSVGSDGSPLPLGNGLASEIASRFDLPDTYPLAQIANAVDPSELSPFLRGRFSGCTASTRAMLLGQFLWKRIYSYNVDDVVDSIYKNPDVQQRLEVISHRDAFKEVDDLGTVQLVCLHGTVSRPQDGFVFSTQAYARHVDEHAPWQYIFADELTSQPFIVVGCNLSEFDLEVFLSRRASVERLQARAFPSIFVTKKPDKVLEAACRQHGLKLLPTSADDFLEDLLEEVPERPSALEVLRPRTISQFLTANHAAERVFFSQWCHVSDILGSTDSLDLDECPHLLSGVEPQWSHLLRNELVPRDDVSTAAAGIVKWAKGSARSGIRALYAPAGSGKSAVLLLLGEALAKAGVPVYSLHVDRRIGIDAAVEVLRASEVPVVLICDSLADHIDQLSDLLEKLPNGKCRVLIVGAERGTRRQLIDDLAGDLFLESSTISRLSRDEALAFVEALRRHGFLGVRAGETDA